MVELKNKNNDLVPQIFLTVTGVILTGIIIYYIMNSVKSTSGLANGIIAKTEETASEFSEHDILMYDGETVRGAEVVNFIKKHLGDYSETETAPVYVEVLKSGSSDPKIYTNNKYISEIKNFSNSEHYIKPTALFTGQVIRNENKVILGIKFVQK